MIRRRPKIKLNENDRVAMRAACQFNSQMMDFIRPEITAGITTRQLDRIVHDYTLEHGHKPACLGYPGDTSPFPRSCCISVNEVVCHGIPGDYRLKVGDIVNIDLTTVVDGWFGDQSETFLIGKVDELSLRVTQCAFDSLHRAIGAIYPDCPVAIIGQAITQFVRSDYPGFGVVDKYVGHGIGTCFHQRPNIPHVPTRQGWQERLRPGMCFTIEPMINGGTANCVSDKHDGWTVRTSDGLPSAQFEHTVLMTERGPEILTRTKHGPQPGYRF